MGLDKQSDTSEKSGGFLKVLGSVPGMKESVLGLGLFLHEPALSSLGHSTETQAAEIGPKETWKGGITKMFDSADQNPREVQTYFLQTKEGKIHWIRPISGTSTGLNVEHLRLSPQESREIKEFVAQNDVESCGIHTHGKGPIAGATQHVLGAPESAVPSELTTLAGAIDLKRPLSLPPSLSDLVAMFIENPITNLINNARKVEQKNAVVDPLFISYYQPFRNATAAKNFRDELKVAPPKFDMRYTAAANFALVQFRWLHYVNSSGESTEKMLSSAQYTELRYAYAMLNVQLRLADRKHFAKEPACAGAADKGAIK